MSVNELSESGLCQEKELMIIINNYITSLVNNFMDNLNNVFSYLKQEIVDVIKYMNKTQHVFYRL